jgi:hypothetical protein
LQKLWVTGGFHSADNYLASAIGLAEVRKVTVMERGNASARMNIQIVALAT